MAQRDPGTQEKGFYITTAIVYPNSRMHVGFGWEAIGADMRARFERMKGRDVFFCTGVDEHSQNVEKAAFKDKDAHPEAYAGLDGARAVAKKYCDKMADDIVKVMGMMDIAYDRFIRTSDPDHERVCQYLIEKASRAGDVCKRDHEGLYCDGCETFYTEKEAVLADAPGYHCPTHKQPLRLLAEENYFFRLSRFQDALKKLFSERPGFLAPEGRRNEVLSFLAGGLKDFSVSRTTFKWGIPIPFDSSHVIYVWFDALINYLSAVKFPVREIGPDGKEGKVVQGDEAFFGRFWPCDVHVIGKDITRFHCLYWPAMLLSTGVPLPERVWAHGFIQFQGEKMSKTRGNIVTPDEVIRDFSSVSGAPYGSATGAPYGATALRWYLLSSNPFDADGNYADESLVLKCNADLANNIGNLVNRTVSMTRRYFPEGAPAANPGALPAGVAPVGARLAEHLGARGERLEAAARAMDLAGYCARLVEFSMSMNKFIDETKPWALAKAAAAAAAADAERPRAQLAAALAELLEGIRCLAIGLWPVIPDAAQAILAQLGIAPPPQSAPSSEDWFRRALHTGREIHIPRLDRLAFDSSRRFQLVPPVPLFPRLEHNKTS